MKPLWLKWYPIKWLHSTARDELDTAERATFQDFVCLAAIGSPPGTFKFVNIKSLSRQLNTDPEIIKRTIEKCIKTKRIEIFEDEEGYICKISKWYIYQTFKEDEGDNIKNIVNNKQNISPSKLTLNKQDKIREDKKREEKKRYIVEIISYLNEKSKKNFKPTTKKTIEYINARLKEGFTVKDFKHVIDVKVADWKDDPKYSKYIQPNTLFNSEKFEGYLNQEEILTEQEKKRKELEKYK